MFRLVPCLVFALIACAPISPQKATEEALRAAPVGSTDLPGVIVFVAFDGGVFEQAAGTAKPGATDAPDVKAVSRIGSATKMMTATVVLQLVAEGKLALTTDVGTLGLGLSRLEGVTVKDLLLMQSGLADYANEAFVAEVAGGDAAMVWTDRQLAERGVSSAPQGTRGAGFSYSNTNYSVLALVIEQVTGRSWATNVTERVITPLGLAETGLPRPMDRRLPSPSLFGSYQGKDVSELHPSYTGAAGVAFSTARELARLTEAVASGTLVSDDSLRPANQPRVDASSLGPLTYGYGLMTMGSWRGHAGDMLGFSCAAFHQPSSGRTVVVLTNGTFGSGLGLAREVINKLAPGSL